MNNGWISIHRKFKDWEWYGDSKIVHLFLHCLLKANHKPSKWRGQDITAGQFITSQTHLSEETGLSVMQVRTILNKLKVTGELTVKITNKYSIISITNWDSHQDDNRQVNTQVTDNQQASNNQITTNNNNNNNNNEDNKPVPAKKPQAIVEIKYPDDLNKTAWQKWIVHRKQAKMKKLTPEGEELAMKNLIAMGDSNTQRLIIEQSMAQGWQGLFELKAGTRPQTNKRDNIMAFVHGDQRREKIIGETYDAE